MARHAQRNPEKEELWRDILARWGESATSQAEFCRQEGLNAQTFSSWKAVIAQRDLEKAATKVRRRAPGLNPCGAVTPAASIEHKPAFLRLQVEERDISEKAAAHKDLNEAERSIPGGQVVAAELTDSRGGRVRIFNGADRPTLSALIAALAAF